MKKTCKYIECDIETSGNFEFCNYHLRGGVLGDGTAFGHYEIIEKDFINFIQIIPLDDKDHFKVYSPVLRDIIIRSCIEIEIFFNANVGILLTKSTAIIKCFLEITFSI